MNHTCAQCALLRFATCPAEPYDEAVARRRFLLEEPPIFRHDHALAAVTASQIAEIERAAS